MKKQEPILPGLEVAIADMESSALSDTAIESLPVYTAERVAVHDTDRYNLAARLLFAENISRVARSNRRKDNSLRTMGWWRFTKSLHVRKC